MSWFTYIDNSTTKYSSVRREIVFSNLSENLAINDWIHVNLDDLDISRFYYYENGLIKSSIDSDSYLVVYEVNNTYTPTYSLIIDGNSEDFYKKNLWFKSVSSVLAGNQPAGKYYIYYHKDNIQYIQKVGNNYQSTESPNGLNYIASQTGSGQNLINLYSVSVTGNSENTRIAAISYLGDTGIWNNQSTTVIGAKAIGTFSGPNFKLYAKKGPDCGKIRVKITKISAVGDGQKIVKSGIDIDLYAPTKQDNQNIYSINIEQENIFSIYEEIYGDFSFEIETLNEKNQASSGNRCTLEKYEFSKNYELSFSNEEIKSDIAFKSIGGLK